jgi:regulator of protease activity HflC (stomatin/prohibitin superfamily)
LLTVTITAETADVPSQVCITRQYATAGRWDPVFSGHDQKLASLARRTTSAITQLAQTTLRSIIGKMELDKTFEERDLINARLWRRSTTPRSWGVKVLRYEIKD